MSPHDYTSPIDHGYAEAQGWDIDRLCYETGRSYERSKYWIEPTDADQADAMQKVSSLLLWFCTVQV